MSRPRIGWLLMDYDNKGKSYIIRKRDRQAMEARALRPTKKPDADNILKVIADSLNGVAYHDDAPYLRHFGKHAVYGEEV